MLFAKDKYLKIRIIMKIYNNDANFVNSLSEGVSVENLDGGYLFKFSDGTTSLSRWGTTNISFSAVECRAKEKQTCIIQLFIGKDIVAGKSIESQTTDLAKRYVIFGYDGKILGNGEFERCTAKIFYPTHPSTAKSDYIVVTIQKYARLNAKSFNAIYSCAGAFSCSTKSIKQDIKLIPANKKDRTFIPIAEIIDDGKTTLINVTSKKILTETEECGNATCIYDEAKQKSPYILFSPNDSTKKVYARIYDISGKVIMGGLPQHSEWVHLEDHEGSNDYLMCSDLNNILSAILVMDKNGDFVLSKLNDILGLSEERLLTINKSFCADYLEHGLLLVSEFATKKSLSNFITSNETLLFDEWVNVSWNMHDASRYVPLIDKIPLSNILIEYENGDSKNYRKIDIINAHTEEKGKLYEFDFDEPLIARSTLDPLFKIRITFLKYKGKENFFLYSNSHYQNKSISEFNDLLCLDHWVDGIFIGKIDATSNDSALFVKDNGKLFFLNLPKILYDYSHSYWNKGAENTYLYDCECIEYSKFLTNCPKSYSGNQNYRFGYIFIYDKNKITILSLRYLKSMSYDTNEYEYNEFTANDAFDTNMVFPIIEENGKYAYLKPDYDIVPVAYLNNKSMLITNSGTGEFFDDAQSAYCVNGKWYFPVMKDGDNLTLNVGGYSVN